LSLIGDDETRKNTPALELARLDELQETLYARATGSAIEAARSAACPHGESHSRQT
jgi:hypothetical protein